MDIERLSQLHSPLGSLVSVFVNHPPGPSAAAITDVLKPLRGDLDGLDRRAAMSVRRDVERIAELDARIDAETAPAYCVFASSEDGIFEFFRLPAPVWDYASVGRRPYLRPLRALPERLRAGVVVADRKQATVWVADDGELTRLGEPITAELGKGNYGGFRGYDEHRARGHADEEASRITREAAGRVFVEHQERPLDFIAVGGHQETLDAVGAHLHPYLKKLPVSHFVVDPHTLTEAELRSRVAAAADELRHRRDEQAVTRVLETVDRGGTACLGTATVLRAASARAVEELVVAGTFAKPGVVCANCGWMARQGEHCPGCSAPVDQVDDVVAEAMEAAIAGGGTVRQVAVASRLDADGVGAILRFPV